MITEDTIILNNCHLYNSVQNDLQKLEYNLCSTDRIIKMMIINKIITRNYYCTKLVIVLPKSTIAPNTTFCLSEEDLCNLQNLYLSLRS